MVPPDCEAWIEHVPLATIVTVSPLTVHFDVVSDTYDTASPDDAVAVKSNGSVLVFFSLIVPKVMVCGAPTEMLSMYNSAPDHSPPEASKVPLTKTKR